ncbi:repressible acid phosphatase [Pseudovirgaria hyperparasitica]|uniref:Repressible acid phosphatase n=1 Tax=Pseudovirgaria hyperparasitica TaxID=470096 RepID=A0A6A6W7R8_9PEZI|nr:repressible acid phosphatase [Pseudovirgaria hyperparasitica]KAF2758683.1 repressible acid phosphatase [Pseudovirgaria hyperparasitica]
MRSSAALAPLAFSVAAAYSFDPLEHLAGIAPYFEPEDPPSDPAPPQGCNVTRAAYIVRHAAIYANDFDFESYIEPFVMKLGNTTADWSKTRDLSFLTTWKSPIEDEDLEDLTKVGELEAFKLGVQVKQRYQYAKGGKGFNKPGKVWASTAERTTISAQSFIDGYTVGQNSTKLEGISEASEEGADSLTPHQTCPNYSGSRGSEQSGTYQKIYTKPIVERLNAQASAFNFTMSDVVGMQQLCGYETVIRGESPFCSLSLFTPNEWLSFEYMNDIMYHHSLGYGSPGISGAQGFPWTNATAQLLLAPANSSDIQDLYVSFAHRELPPNVLVALGLFNNTAFTNSLDYNATMPLTQISTNRVWQSSRILPFLSNIAMEKLSCDSYGYEPGEFIRVLVNQAPQPLPGCVDGPAESCGLSGFQEFIKARGEMFGDFDGLCGVDYSNSTNILSIYGQQ